MVNGEGSFHNNSKKLLNTLYLVSSKKKKKKINAYLINALINNNKFLNNKSLLNNFKLIYLRSEYNRKQLLNKQKKNRKCKVAPDLIFYKFPKKLKSIKSKTKGITDHTNYKVSKILFDYSMKNNSSFIPLLHAPIFRSSPIKIWYFIKFYLSIIIFYYLKKLKFKIQYQHERKCYSLLSCPSGTNKPGRKFPVRIRCTNWWGWTVLWAMARRLTTC